METRAFARAGEQIRKLVEKSNTVPVEHLAYHWETVAHLALVLSKAYNFELQQHKKFTLTKPVPNPLKEQDDPSIP